MHVHVYMDRICACLSCDRTTLSVILRNTMYLLRHDLLLALTSPFRLAIETHMSSCFCFPGIGITAVYHHIQLLYGYWDLNIGSPVCTASTLPIELPLHPSIINFDVSSSELTYMGNHIICVIVVLHELMRKPTLFHNFPKVTFMKFYDCRVWELTNSEILSSEHSRND